MSAPFPPPSEPAVAPGLRPRVRSGAITAVAVTAVLTGAAFALLQAADRRDAQARLGTTSREVGLWLALAGACALGGAFLLAVRTRRTRRPPATVAVAVAVAAVAGIAGLGSAVAVAATTTGCDAFRFDATRWVHPAGDDEAEALGDAVARCHIVTGRDRAAVRRILGMPGAPGEGPWTTGSRTWAYGLALQDAGGLGPTLREVRLLVRFGPDGRATGARVQEDVRAY